MKTQHILLFPLSLLFFLSAYAQTDSTLNKQVEVIKAYQPSITDAYKIGTNPKINDTINYSPTFEYNISSRDIPVEKTINHLPVVQLGSAPRNISNTGYIKAGFGNAWTPYGELFINNSPTKKTDFGLQVQHFSSRPTITLNNDLKIKTPNSSNLARIFVKNYFRKSVLDWEAKYQRDRFNYYGFPGTDSLLYRNTEAASAALNSKQVLNTASGNLRLKNMNNRATIDYDLKLAYDYFWNATGQSSHHASYDGNYLKSYRKFDVSLGSRFEYFNQDSLINQDGNPVSQHPFYHAVLSPKIAIDKDIYQLSAGFNLGSIIGADSTLLWNISPNIYFAYHPIKGIMTLFAGANGGFSPNGIQQITSHNPYINPNTELMPSEEVISLFGGFKGKISRNLSYLFDVNYSINQNTPFFYLEQNNSTPSISSINNQFSVAYDDLNLLQFGGKIRYSSNSLTLDLKGNYYLYDLKTLTTASHLPDFDFDLNTSIKISSRINGRLDATVIGPREAMFQVAYLDALSGAPTTSLTTNNLDMVLDLSLGLDYSYTNKLNFYMDAKNLLNQQYEIWNGYKQQGLLIMLGGSYTF